MKQPSWITDYKKSKPEVKEQMTIIKAAPRVEYTGAGPDGVVQPHMPIQMVPTTQGPRTIHEGEAKVFRPDGGVDVISQPQLAEIERRHNIPGLQNSGAYTPIQTTLTGSKTTTSTPAQPTVTTNDNGQGQDTMPQNMGTVTGDAYRAPSVMAPQQTPQQFQAPLQMGQTYNTPTIKAPAAPAPMLFAPIQLPPQQQTTYTTPKIAAPQATAPVPIQIAPIQPPAQQTALPPPPAPVPAVPPQQTTPTTPVPPPPPVTTSPYNANINAGYQNFVSTMEGNNPVLKNEEQRILSQMGATGAAKGAAAMQRLAQKGVSDPLSRVVMSDLERNQETAMDNVRADIYSKNADAQQAAARDVVTLGSNLRTYDQITLPANEQNLLERRYGLDRTKATDVMNDIKANVPFSELKDRIMATRPGMTEAEAQAFFNDVKRGEVTVNTGDRIGMLIDGGQGFAAIAGDQSIRDQIAKDLGVAATDPRVDAEVRALWNATVLRNKAQYMTQADTLLAEHIDMRGTADTAVGDKNIRSAVALSMGLDPGDTSNVAAVDAEIRRRYSALTMPETDRIFNNFVDNGWIDDRYKDTPEWQAEFKSTIRDLRMKGLLDADGQLIEGATVDWPWDDPDTFHHYTDWNGQDITYGADGTLPPEHGLTQVNFDGNGTTYFKTNADGTTRAITFNDLTSTWNSLGVAEREAHFTGGKPDMKWLMAQAGDSESIAGPNGTGKTFGSAGDYIDYFSTPEGAQNLATIEEYVNKGQWQTSAAYPSDYVDETKRGASISATDPNAYVYYDQDGQIHYDGRTTDPKFKLIWQQLSSVYNNNVPLNPAAFALRWNDGKGWLVDDNGIILNLKNPSEYAMAGATTENPQVDMAKASGLFTMLAIGDIMKVYSPGTDYTISRTTADHALANMTNMTEQAMFISKPITVGTQSQNLTDFNTTNYGDERWNGEGEDRWALTENALNWTKKNIGKLYPVNDNLYEVMGIHISPDKKDSTEYIVLRDVVTGKLVGYSKDAGKGTDRIFTPAESVSYKATW